MLDYVRGGQLELYEDSLGRMYAVDLEDVGGLDVARPERVVEKDHAYVLFESARGLEFGATEEDLGGRAMPEEGTAVTLVHATGVAATAKKVKISHKWLDAPSNLTIRVARAYRYKTRLSGKIEYVVVAKK